MTLFISRIRLSRNPGTQALAPLLSPNEAGRRVNAAHSILWAAFSDGSERQRDFLWRQEGKRDYLALSAREPIANDLFAPHQVKPFDPKISAGDRIAFKLRANATRTEKAEEHSPSGKPRRRHIDLVMDRLYQLPNQPGERALKRMAFAQEVAQDWLALQGGRAGFQLMEVIAQDYSVLALRDRGPRKGQPQIGVLDLLGHLEITDPALFLSKVSHGFGRAKAFGCGLMVLRKAR